MALIGKIRKNFWFVLVLLAMALASFIIMDVMGSRKGGGAGSSSTTIGKVAGEKIDYRDFERVERTLFQGNNGDVYGKRQSIWNFIVERAMVQSQAEKLGLEVSKEELMALQFDPANLSPIVRNNFGDPNTGQIDIQRLLQFKQAFESGQDLNPEFSAFWAEQEKQIVTASIQEKINNLVSKAIIIPKWQKDISNQLANEKLNIEFVKVGYDKVADTEIKLTDDDYKAFLAKNPGRYTNEEETRIIQYAALQVLPTKGDSTEILNKLASLKSQFANATNDSLFAVSNGGALVPAYQKFADITGSLKDSLSKMSIGSIVGPYEMQGNFLLTKLVGKAVIADSVKARHILKSANTPAGMIAARKSIDSLKALLVSGRAKFDSLAIRNSEDQGSAVKGGDLGTFAQGTMVQQFNDACFVTGKPGGIYTVQTQFGIHLIEVQSQKFVDKSPKYKFATIAQAITPSEATQDLAYDKINTILSKIKNTDDLANISKSNPEIVVQTTKGMGVNDFNIQGFTGSETSRSIVKKAYNSDLKEISKTVYSYSDPNTQAVNNYIIAGLKSINKPGLISIEEAKANLEAQVKNYKKGEYLKSKITSTDLNAIAAQYGTNVDTSNVSFSAGYIESLQASEPLVVAKLFSLEKGGVSKAIAGNSGVFVAKIKEKSVAVSDPNGNAALSQLAGLKQSAGFRIWEALKKKIKPEDNRAKFF
jgi:peptidyl-prolyl cis-trans isomerase D